MFARPSFRIRLVRPISGSGPRLDALPVRRPGVAPRGVPAPYAVERVVRMAAVARADAREADVELSVRMLADGGRVSVMRRTVLDDQGVRQTVGIDAVIQ